MSAQTKIGPKTHAALIRTFSLGSVLLPRVQGTSWCLSDMNNSECPKRAGAGHTRGAARWE